LPASDLTRKAYSTPDAPKPAAAYSVGMQAAGLVFTAGQGGHHPETGELPDGIEAQTRQALENVEAILRAGSSSLASALKVSIFLADRADYAAMNAVYAEYMPDDPAVRTTVQAGLGKGMLVEIDAIALAEPEA
jgi:2-iminobutanoate/2-iminopropanoate deaminase